MNKKKLLRSVREYIEKKKKLDKNIFKPWKKRIRVGILTSHWEVNVLRRRKIIKIFFALLCCCCLSRKSFSLKKWLLLKRIYWEKLLLTFLSGGCVQRIKIVPKITAHKCSDFLCMLLVLLNAVTHALSIFIAFLSLQ